MTKVIYKNNADDKILGSIEYSDLSEVLIPDFKPDKHKIFLRHVFKSRPEVHLWLVVSLDVDNHSVIISLDEKTSPDSLGEFARKQMKKPASILRPNQFQLVEVEFGFQQDIFNGADRKRNELISIALMPGELHKKRPCIVLRCENETVQVLPLTTKGTVDNPRNMPISEESFNGLSSRYREQPSKVLASMIQTVSVFRIYPMKNHKGMFSHDYPKHKLCAQDKRALVRLLGSNYAKSTFAELTNTSNQLANLQTEKAKLLDSIKKHKHCQEDLVQKLERSELYLGRLAQFLGISFEGLDDLLSQIDALTE